MSFLVHVLLWGGALIGIVVLGIFVLSTYANITYDRFLISHALPVELEQLMAFGAPIPRHNGTSTRVVPLDCPKEKVRPLLMEYWCIGDEASAKARLHGLIAGGLREHCEPHFKAVQSNEEPPADFEDFDIADLDAAKELWLAKGLPEEAVSSCRSMAAFDYVRAADLARTCHYAGFLDEPLMWRCIAWSAYRARSEFDSWEHYAASFLLGRSAYYGVERLERMTDALVDLLGDSEGGLLGSKYPHLWQTYPLAKIQVPERMLHGDLLHDLS